MNRLPEAVYRISVEQCKKLSMMDLVEILRNSRGIIARYPTKDELIVSYPNINRSSPDVHPYIRVFYAESFDIGADEPQYMTCNTEYFGVNEPELAIISFMSRLNQDGRTCSGMTRDMERIKK